MPYISLPNAWARQKHKPWKAFHSKLFFKYTIRKKIDWITKPSLKPTLKSGPAPRPAAKPTLLAPQYTEEYDIAEPLIASILWSRSSERKQASLQLDSVNDQIRAKNIKHKISKANGCIDIAAFKTAAEQLGQASIAFAASQDTKLFSHTRS